MLTREQAYEIIANYEYIMFGCNYGTAAGRELIDKIYDEHEAQMKAKNSKARSIVSMLFWEWRKAKRDAKALMHTEYQNGFRDGKEDIVEKLFKQAYKILKDKA